MTARIDEIVTRDPENLGEGVMVTFHDVTRIWKAAIGAAAISLLTLEASCSPKVILVWRFECPNNYGISIRQADTTGGRDSTIDSIGSIPLSGPISNIPEYHDCQRFVEQGKYGSVYAIFAGFRLDTVSGNAAGPMSFATIYSPDGVYPTLGIAPGFNCLALTKSGDVWTATMIVRGQGKLNADCSGTPTGDPKTVLEVRQQPVDHTAGFGSLDFPPVARWDWDSVNGKQYIGIRCGSAWCEVGAPKFMSSPVLDENLSFEPIPGVGSPTRASIRVQRIKGWYDEQWLADTLQPQRPGPVHGLIIPNPALDMISWLKDDTPKHDHALQFYGAHWVHVAYVLVDAPYVKWHFTKASEKDRYGKNKIYLCFGTALAKSCNVPASKPKENSHSLSLSSCESDPTNPALHWWAMTVSATNDTTYGCVRRADHSAQLDALKSANPDLLYGIPGTARWKFLSNDESTWVSCPSGCCTKQ